MFHIFYVCRAKRYCILNDNKISYYERYKDAKPKGDVFLSCNTLPLFIALFPSSSPLHTALLPSSLQFLLVIYLKQLFVIPPSLSSGLCSLLLLPWLALFCVRHSFNFVQPGWKFPSGRKLQSPIVLPSRMVRPSFSSCCSCLPGAHPPVPVCLLLFCFRRLHVLLGRNAAQGKDTRKYCFSCQDEESLRVSRLLFSCGA